MEFILSCLGHVTNICIVFLQHVNETYSALSAEPGPHFEIEFEEENISLDIPDDGLWYPPGWNILPLTAPVVGESHLTVCHLFMYILLL